MYIKTFVLRSWSGHSSMVERASLLTVAALLLTLSMPAYAEKSETKAALKSTEASAEIAPMELPKEPQNPFDYAKQTLQISGPLPNLQTLPLVEMGKLLYTHLLAEVSPERTSTILESTMPRLGKPCSSISAFQVYRYRTGARTLKIKCPGKPLFVLSVNHFGTLQVSGGDGSIGELSNVDGRIYSLFGKRIDAPKVPFVAPAPVDLSGAPQKPAIEQSALPKRAITEPVINIPEKPTALPEPSEVPPGYEVKSKFNWFWIANSTGALSLLLGIWGWRRSNKKLRLSDDWGLSSDDKDALIDESREIYPNIFHHPQGFYISRGGRGKRRIFKSTFSAILYRDYGIKLSEIKI
jgi:hypothetical protein